MATGKKFGPFKALSMRRNVDGRRSVTFDPGAVVKALRRRRKERKSQAPPPPR